jgi:DNA-binding response OmpR family regulator
MNVLLVEPDKILADTYHHALTQDGHRVKICSDAEKAVVLCNNWQPDVAIIELLLNHHSGIEFLYEFRSYSDWQAVPIIVHSYITPSEIKRYEQTLHELNVQTYLYKPYTSLSNLKRTILLHDVAISTA